MNKLFVFEGCDGSGKSTLSQLVYERLLKYDPLKIQMPGGTQLGIALRQIIKSKAYTPDVYAERLLFAADFQQAVSEVIAPAIKQGRVIICDRWYPLTDQMYSYPRYVTPTFFNTLHALINIPMVSTMFLVDAPDEVSAARRAARNDTLSTSDAEKACRIEALGDDFMSAVANNYRVAFKNEAFIRQLTLNFKVLDGSKKPIELADAAMAVIEPHLKGA